MFAGVAEVLKLLKSQVFVGDSIDVRILTNPATRHQTFTINFVNVYLSDYCTWFGTM